MSKEVATVKCYSYVVYTDTGCSVTDAATGKVLTYALPGQPNAFTALGDSTILSDDSADLVKPVFKNAPIVHGWLAGGGSALPAGYAPAAFLESTGSQFIELPALTVTDEDTVRWSQQYVADGGNLSSIDGVWAAKNDTSGCRFYTNASSGRAILGLLGASASCSLEQYKAGRSFQASKSGLTVDGVLFAGTGTASGSRTGFYIGTQKISGVAYNAKIRLMCFGVGPKCRLIPAVDPSGEPCMLDLVNKTPHYNAGSGNYTVGASLEQVGRLVHNLPATGGIMKLSLPEGYEASELWPPARAMAEAKGWRITLQTYPSATAAATYSMRRVRRVVWCRMTPSEHGAYVDPAGHRTDVQWCADIVGSTPEAEGYEPFDSTAAAAEHWQLVPYEAPEEENLTNE